MTDYSQGIEPTYEQLEAEYQNQYGLMEEERIREMTNKQPKPITEEMNIHCDWYARAHDQTLETLPEFLDLLAHDYIHDYGTIVHAITAAAVGAAHAMDRSPEGGITGFQASCVMWQFVKEWWYRNNTCGLKIIDYDKMLYPQYGDRFEKSISPKTWSALQAEAQKQLDEDATNPRACGEVRAHWLSIVNGEVPFGYTLRED